jgi:ankyrin repeat protein
MFHQHVSIYRLQCSDHANIVARFLIAVLNFQFVIMVHGTEDLSRSLQVLEDLRSDDDGRDTYKDIVLDKAFTRYIKRAVEQPESKGLVERALGFVRDVQRPLTTLELVGLLRVKEVHGKMTLGSEILWETIRVECQGLLLANEDDVVDFLHPSLRAYLSHDHEHSIPEHHGQLAKRCLAYLSYGCSPTGFYDSQESLDYQIDAWPLLSYAARYWSHHLRVFEIRTETETDTQQARQMVHEAALAFLKQDTHVQACFQIMLLPDKVLQAVNNRKSMNKKMRIESVLVSREATAEPIDPFSKNEMTGLRLACFLGVHTLIHELLLEYTRNDISFAERDSIDRVHYLSALSHVHLAVLSGCPHTVSAVLSEGLDPGRRNILGLTPLMLAATLRRDDVLEVLLKKGQKHVLINAQTPTQDKPSNLATRLYLRYEGDEMRVSNVFTEYTSVSKRTALHYAAREGSGRAVELLLDAQADMDIEDSQGQTALHKAAKKGHLEVLQALVRRGMNPAALVGEKSHSVPSSLYRMAQWVGVTDTAPTLSKSSFYGWTALHLASPYRRSNAIVKYLCAEYPDICTKTTPSGETPLHLAAESGVIENMRILVDSGTPTISNVSNNGKTLLHAVADNESTAGLELMFEKTDIDVNAEDADGWTPLHYAALSGEVQNVKLLLSRPGIIVKHRDKKGVSVVAKAMWVDPGRVLRLLCDSIGQDIDFTEADAMCIASSPVGRRFFGL